MNKKSILVLVLITLLLGGFIGYYIGSQKEVEKEIQYIEVLPEREIESPKDIVKPIVITELDTVYLPDRVKTQLLEDSIKLLKGKLTNIPNVIEVDDSFISLIKTYNDYITLKSYNNQIMFDNEFGKYTTSFDIQYNEIQRFYNTKLQPNQLVKEKIVFPKLTPFIEGGYSTADYLNIGGGIISNKNKIGLRYNYQYDLDRSIKRDGHLFTIIKTF